MLKDLTVTLGALLAAVAGMWIGAVLTVEGIKRGCDKSSLAEISGEFYRCEPIKWERGK